MFFQDLAAIQRQYQYRQILHSHSHDITANVARVKVVLVGALDAGKTNLANNLCIPGFNENSDSTEGINFLHMCATLQDGLHGVNQPDCGPLLGTESDTSISASSLHQAVLQRVHATTPGSSSTAAAHTAARPRSATSEPSARSRETASAGSSHGDQNLHLKLAEDMESTPVHHLTESSVFVDLLDCGGQLSFSVVQALAFDADDGIFLVVYDSSVSLDAELYQVFRRRGKRIPQLALHLTHGEYLSLWLSTLAMARRPGTAKPLVMLVGTHSNKAGKPGVERSRREATALMKRFERLPLKCRGPYFIDNSTPTDEQMKKLRRQVHSLVREKAKCGHVPVSFLKTEWALKRHLGATAAEPCVPLSRFKRFAVEEIGVHPEKILDLLDYLHGSSVIRSFDHRNPTRNAYVYQSTAWFIAQVTKVLTAAMDPEFVDTNRADIDRLKTTGILTDRLCGQIWADLPLAARHNLLTLMEKSGLLCPVTNREAYRIPPEAGNLYLIPMCIQQPPGLSPLQPGIVSLAPVLLYYSDEFLPFPLYMRVAVDLLKAFQHPTRPEIGIRQVRFCCHSPTRYYYVEMSYTLRGIALAMFCTDGSAANGDMRRLGVPDLRAMSVRVLQTTDRIFAKLRGESWQSLPDWCPAFPCPDHAGE